MKITAFLIATAAAAMVVLAAHADTIDPAQAIAQKFSEASDEKPVLPQRSFARPGADYEADMLARARAEELERHQKKIPQVATRPPVPTPDVSVPAAPAPPVAPVSKLAALPPKPAAETPVVLHAEPPEPRISTATVLLVLDPDGTGLDIKPDPIICIDNSCWLSSGMSAPARRMPRNQAVALEGTAGMTAESCSGKSGCAYRNVAIDPADRIDVIEVGEGGGASVGAYTIAVDPSCRATGQSLICDNGLATQNFHIWVVPEATAEAAGPLRLENAVAEGLPDADVMSAKDK